MSVSIYLQHALCMYFYVRDWNCYLSRFRDTNIKKRSHFMKRMLALIIFMAILSMTSTNTRAESFLMSTAIPGGDGGVVCSCTNFTSNPIIVDFLIFHITGGGILPWPNHCYWWGWRMLSRVYGLECLQNPPRRREENIEETIILYVLCNRSQRKPNCRSASGYKI